MPKEFLLRRLHSLTGIFLSLFLIEHLLVNSQAALFFGDDGKGFIESVNGIHSLPYLALIEIALLAIPLLLHIVIGIQILKTAAYNSLPGDGAHPSLGGYERNRAYTWQRITAWILMVAVIGHIIHMRVIEYPKEVKLVENETYLVPLKLDDGLETVSARLGVTLYSASEVEAFKGEITPAVTPVELQEKAAKERLAVALERELSEGNSLVAKAPDFGTAELLVIREAFKSPLIMGLYALFVLLAVYHAYNGLWTFLIRWGVTLSHKAQRIALKGCVCLMIGVAFLGMAAIFGTYWINLRH